MAKIVTQAQYIAHYESEIKADQKRAIDQFNTLGHFQMADLIKNIKASKKKIGFARSGLQKEFFI